MIADAILIPHQVAQSTTDRIEYSAEEWGISEGEVVSEIRDELMQILTDAPVSMRTTPEVLDQILGDARVKNLFETGAGFGWSDHELRRDAEFALFGIDPEEWITKGKVDAAERPIYGYMDVDDGNSRIVPGDAETRKSLNGYYGASSLERQASLDQYGEVRVEFKDSVRDRTTFTFGDSLAGVGKTMPSPVNDPAIESLGNAWSAEFRSHPTKNLLDSAGRYVEAQIIGGVSAADIGRVVFPAQPSPDIAASVEAAGIEWTVAEPVAPGVMAGFPDEPWPPGEEPIAASAGGKVIYVDPSGATISDAGVDAEGRPLGQITRDGVVYDPAPLIALLAHGYWHPVDDTEQEQLTIGGWSGSPSRTRGATRKAGSPPRGTSHRRPV